MAFLLGKKVGMTRFFQEDGVSVPVTVIKIDPCVVTQIKTTDSDGYAAVQLGTDETDARQIAMPQIGHDHKAGSAPLRSHREFRVDDDAAAEAFEVGQRLTVADFEGTLYVDVCGTSKGKGFAGGMKRHGFKGQPASHGIKRVHRSPGSIGGHATNLGTGPKLKKGKRMSGHMGDVRMTTRSLDIVSIDTEKNLLLVKGAVPGANTGLLAIRTAVRLNRRKTRLAKEAAK